MPKVLIISNFVALLYNKRSLNYIYINTTYISANNLNKLCKHIRPSTYLKCENFHTENFQRKKFWRWKFSSTKLFDDEIFRNDYFRHDFLHFFAMNFQKFWILEVFKFSVRKFTTVYKNIFKKRMNLTSAYNNYKSQNDPEWIYVLFEVSNH